MCVCVCVHALHWLLGRRDCTFIDMFSAFYRPQGSFVTRRKPKPFLMAFKNRYT